jgi:hypothetical protein
MCWLRLRNLMRLTLKRGCPRSSHVGYCDGRASHVVAIVAELSQERIVLIHSRERGHAVLVQADHRVQLEVVAPAVVVQRQLLEQLLAEVVTEAVPLRLQVVVGAGCVSGAGDRVPRPFVSKRSMAEQMRAPLAELTRYHDPLPVEAGSSIEPRMSMFVWNVTARVGR